jgi:Fe-Mn family superoxide dismutase
MTPHLGSAIRLQHGSIAQLKSTFSSAALGLATSGWIWFVTDKSGNTGIIPTFGPGTLVIRSRSHMAHNQGLLLGEDLAQWGRGDPVLKEQNSPSPSSSQCPTPPTTPRPAPAPTSTSPPPGVPPSSPASGVSGPSTPDKPSHLFPRFFHSTPRSSFLLNQTPSSVWDEALEAMDIPMPRTKVDMMNIGETLYPLFCLSVHEHCWMSAGYGVWGKEDWLKQFWTVLDWDKVSQAYHAVYPEKPSNSR